MKNKSLLRFIAMLMLTFSFIVTPTINFIEPAAAAKKASKKRTARRKKSRKKTSGKKQGTLYRCARCGAFWNRGIDSVWDFIHLQQECRYGGMHAWRKMK
ncbi:MAG: hypothetical protein IJ587_08500 [Synergistaceae bacterium]|nr:hypothetical protein [Synergistaceae bacterium]